MVMLPGVVAGGSVTLAGPSFAILGLLGTPVACSAAAAGVRRRERWDRAAVVRTFASTAMLSGAAGTGLVALTASAAVVAYVVLGPDPDRFLIRPSPIADDAP